MIRFAIPKLVPWSFISLLRINTYRDFNRLRKIENKNLRRFTGISRDFIQGVLRSSHIWSRIGINGGSGIHPIYPSRRNDMDR